MKIKHKYGAKPTERDGIKFASKAESKYYEKLKLLQKNGDILFFLRQTPFHLPGNVKYLVDFVEFWASGDVVFTDVKGFFTPISSLKIKQVEDCYFPVKINIVKG